MKRARKLVAALTVCAMAFTLTACGGGNNAKQEENTNAEPVVLKLATTVNEQDSFQIAAEKFAGRFESKKTMKQRKGNSKQVKQKLHEKIANVSRETF